MSVRFVKHSAIVSNKWNECISKSCNKKIYGLYEYLNIATEWDALIFNDYEAVMPLPRRKIIGITQLYQPFFCQQLGVFHQENFDLGNLSLFFKKITQLYKFGHVQLNVANLPVYYHQYIGKKNKIEEKTNYILFLDKPYEEQYKNYTTKCKQSIKKSQLASPHISIEDDIDAAIRFYQINYGKRTPHVQSPDFKKLRELLSLSFLKNRIYVYRNPQHEIEAVVVYIIFQDQIYFMLSGSIGEAKQNCALFYMKDDMIKSYSDQNYILDFEGSNIPAIARFNSGFGAKPETYYSLYFSSKFSILGNRMMRRL